MAKLKSPGLFAAGIVVLLPLPPAYCAPPGLQDTSPATPNVIARRHFFRTVKPTAQAMASADRLVQTRPSAEAFYRRAFLRYLSKQYAAAAADSEQSLKLQKSQAAYSLLANCSLLQGPQQWRKALAAASGMAKANPEASYPNQYAAFIEALCGDFDRSMDHLAAYAAQEVMVGRANNLAPDLSEVGNFGPGAMERIISCLGKSDKEKTKRQLALALAALFRSDCVRSVALITELGPAADGPKHDDQGEDNLALAISICIDQRQTRPSHVEEKALKLVQRTGESQAALSLLDTTYFVLGERDKSLAYLDHLIERERAKTVHFKPGDKIIDLLYARARMHEQMSDTRPALSDCQAILKLDPDQKKARLEACRYKLMLNEKQEVLPVLDKYLNKYPGDGIANFLRAQIFVLDKKWQPAARDLSRTIDDGYYVIKALRGRAACYRAMHQDSLAASDTDMAENFRLDNIFVRNLSATVDH